LPAPAPKLSPVGLGEWSRIRMTDRVRFTDEQPGGADSRMLDSVLDRAHRRGHAGKEAVAGACTPGVLREHQPAYILGVSLAAAAAELSHADLLTRW